MSRYIRGQNRSPVFLICGANNVVEHYRKRIKISVLFYCTITNTYKKIGDLFWPVHISGLSQSVSNKSFENILKLEFSFAFRCSRCKWVQKLWLSVLLRHLKWDLKNSSNHKILFSHKGPCTNYVNKILAETLTFNSIGAKLFFLGCNQDDNHGSNFIIKKKICLVLQEKEISNHRN